MYPIITGYMWVTWAGEGKKKGAKFRERFPLKSYERCSNHSTQIERFGNICIENCEEHSYAKRNITLIVPALSVIEDKE
jgi:hypothetical protein